MKAAGLAGVSRRRSARTKIRNDRVRPSADLVDRNFYAARPNLALDRPCHEQGRPARVYVIIRDGTHRSINAVAESFFRLLKRERSRRRAYPRRDAARQDVFKYVEMFYNPKGKHTNNGMLSPVDFEIGKQKLNEAGV